MKNLRSFVTQPRMPQLEEFIPYLEEIWRTKCLTNAGLFHQQLELALTEFLGVGHIALVANGTIALIIAIRALGLHGEVITTPFSFVATAHALLWNGLKPVFVDIDPVTCNLDPAAVEAAITPRTSAILPVHCFGHPCDTVRLKAIGDRHAIPVIYDAAHAFGVRKEGDSILRHGALSALSFHATKVFNTFEGGAIVCRDSEMADRLSSLRNFGFTDDTTVSALGLNGKMSEVHAAFGLLQLRHLPAAIAARADVSARYHAALGAVAGITLFPTPADVAPNHSYFPILVGPGFPISRDALQARLAARGIYARRYFYPLISDMAAYRDDTLRLRLPQARRVADTVLCLPIYPDFSEASQGIVIETILTAHADRDAA